MGYQESFVFMREAHTNRDCTEELLLAIRALGENYFFDDVFWEVAEVATVTQSFSITPNLTLREGEQLLWIQGERSSQESPNDFFPGFTDRFPNRNLEILFLDDLEILEKLLPPPGPSGQTQSPYLSFAPMVW